MMTSVPEVPPDVVGEPDEKRLPGVYVLVFLLHEAIEIPVGKLGSLAFSAGGYAYVGSGMAGVETRIRRHLRRHERPRWHLDYLLPFGQPAAAIIGYTAKRLECSLAGSIGRRFQVFRRFGSSDCRCPGHLFRSEDLPSMANTAVNALRRLGCTPKVLPLSGHYAPSSSGHHTPGKARTALP